MHADFASGAKELKDQLHNVPAICCSALGGKEWLPHYTDHPVQDHQQIQLGDTHIESLFTPGHTPEHLTWIVHEPSQPPYALTGDFLFVGSIGRPDLLGIDELASQLYNSIFNILPTLPDNLKIYPGHGAGSFCGKGLASTPTSTLKDERKNNPYLQHQPEDTWRKNLLKNMPRAPAYFSRMKKLNIIGPTLTRDIPPPQENQPGFLLDIRPTSTNKAAIHIPLEGSFLTWASEFVPYDQPITLIAKDKAAIDKATNLLRIVGIDNIQGYRLDTTETNNYIETLNDNHTIIDVRTPQEWQAGHPPQALHIELNELENRWKEIPRDKPIVVVCASGYRAAIGASILQKHGLENVFNLKGGLRKA